MKDIIIGSLQQSMDYASYRALCEDNAIKGETTGPVQSETLIHFSKLNHARMRRLDKKSVIYPETSALLSQIQRPLTWLVITESWCGDAAQILPYIHKMAEENELITDRYVLRDEHEKLMNLFLTNGGKSIPIIVVWDPTSEEVLAHWGPRPIKIQDMVMKRKASPDPEPYEEFSIRTQKIYLEDKGKMIQEEFGNALVSIIDN